jgi:hypothetical protein
MKHVLKRKNVKRYYVQKDFNTIQRAVNYWIVDRERDNIICSTWYSEYAELICKFLNKEEKKNVKSRTPVK